MQNLGVPIVQDVSITLIIIYICIIYTVKGTC